ncbi:endopeptidase La [Mannheimia haemolytica]|uniref:endopeptidase La n=1 Tax=Mannheimia haemolytica TaxID=75985 RepID=UPI0001BCF9FD|nr:endopeptidase La [Mannheimia haemolytica]EEY11233.1 S16 family endopeptidase La [Mannheimia haemolytica serotype A2 str. OVINE]EEY11892.1 S16 family endopeptidase La [Mannheimia haemolytica serotype A2 str. BOVINE]MDW0722338.1 endopeptidase La [Mannheimia haemolytica]MDW0735333.1 endopeptidase La [Mannheimia haemolytica]TRC14153.1 endopeptidase La [Mannheimia haemolytica]
MAPRKKKAIELPLLPLRDVVVFPYMVMPLFVGREKSIQALRSAMDSNKQLFLVTQQDPNKEEPNAEDMYGVGVIANIIQMLNLPDGTVKVLVEGQIRAKIEQIHDDENGFWAAIQPIYSEYDDENEELKAIAKTTLTEFENYVKNNKKIPAEIIAKLQKITLEDRLADTIASNLIAPVKKKQELLEQPNLIARFEALLIAMATEMDTLETETRIRNRVKQQMEKNQRDYYLNEQIKAIQKELGNGDDVEQSELDKLKEKIDAAKLPTEVKDKLNTEFKKLKAMPQSSSEATVVRGYIDWILQMPWHKKSAVKKDLAQAQEILDKDHYGLERVKERIVEYLAVQSRLNKLKGPILCLVGPPGVGKTSLGQSIANATGRKYVRMALGGVRDEAEIRGHRRTYIGSMPGSLMMKMAKVGVRNPLFLLDEIDKMAQDMRGDPASALLEVLDPEQNKAFNDHYLEVDYDLSDVMFVATSNSMNIPPALLDRMEVIRLSGYTEDEKMHIARGHLLAKQQENNGLKEGELTIEDSAILSIIRYYTREAGVRSLEREIAKICRKAVKALVLDKKLKSITVSEKNIEEYLGVKRFDYGKMDSQNRIGEVTGLAWTEVGGDLLTIETASVAGKGKFSYTGSLGDVMKESIQAAMVVVRSRAEKLGIAEDFHEKRDIHVHVPDGATPKDGPSAGIAMCTALISSLTGNPVRKEVAMTGEISLRGKVLPIGGLKEKLLAAHRGGITTVIIPKENEKDLEEIPENAKAALDIHAVETIDEVLALALENPPMGIEILSKAEIKVKKSRAKATVQ